MKLLVVDDDPVALTLLEAALNQHGYHDVTTAISAEHALNQIAATTEDFDCFLLDVRMPGMDGVELCGRIRTIPAYRSSPVLFVTVVTDRAAIHAAYAAGATDYLSKPIDPIEIGLRLATVEKLVEEERQLRKIQAEANEMRRQIEGYFEFGFEDAIAITDVPHVISRLAFDNYLLGLGRWRLYTSKVVAFRFNEFEQIFPAVSPVECYNLLTDVADAISMGLKQSESLICYAGAGEFLCVTGRSASIINADLPDQINFLLEDFELTYDDGRPLSATISMGDPAMPSLWSSGHAPALVDQAIRSVRAAASDQTSAKPGQVLAGDPRANFNSNLGHAA